MAQSSTATSFSPYDSVLNSRMEEIFRNRNINSSAITDFLRKAPPDPTTGRVSHEDLLRYMLKNMDHPLMRKIADASVTEDVKRLRMGSFDADFTGYDWHSLASTIFWDAESTEGWWYIALEKCAFADAQGNLVSAEDAPKIPGVQPVFDLKCKCNKKIRLMTRIRGLPSSEAIVRFIKRAIVTPVPGMHPGLPRLLLITIKLSPHRAALASFLDTLPSPFKWRIETPQIASEVNDYIDQRTREMLTSYMNAAEVAKTEGNRAFNAKDFKRAIAEYSKAIYHAEDVAASDRGEGAEQAARRLLAMCYANRAAAYLLPGDELDLKKALEDGQQAQTYNPDYAKGYYRQAKAHQALGEVEQAEMTLKRGLSRPTLATDKALTDLLNQLHL